MKLGKEKIGWILWGSGFIMMIIIGVRKMFYIIAPNFVEGIISGILLIIGWLILRRYNTTKIYIGLSPQKL